MYQILHCVLMQTIYQCNSNDKYVDRRESCKSLYFQSSYCINYIYNLFIWNLNLLIIDECLVSEEYEFFFNFWVPLSRKLSFDFPLKFTSPPITGSLASLYNLSSQFFCLIYQWDLLLVLLYIWIHLATVWLCPLYIIPVRRLPCRDDATQIYHVIIDLSDISKIQHYLLIAIIFHLLFTLCLTIFLGW